VCKGVFVQERNTKTCSDKCSAILDAKRKKKHQRENRAQYLKSARESKARHPERVREYDEKYRQQPRVKLYHVIRAAINGRIGKNLRTSKYCRYTIADLQKHLEDRFQPGMTWENRGLYGWHIDHVKPLCKFEFFTSDGRVKVSEVRKAVALKNLQPLWAADNLSKGGR
jgi:hypothetical protein